MPSMLSYVGAKLNVEMENRPSLFHPPCSARDGQAGLACLATNNHDRRQLSLVRTWLSQLLNLVRVGSRWKARKHCIVLHAVQTQAANDESSALILEGRQGSVPADVVIWQM